MLHELKEGVKYFLINQTKTKVCSLSQLTIHTSTGESKNGD